MSSTQEINSSDWDRPFFYYSSRLADPICNAYELLCYRLIAPLDPKKFDNYGTLTQEIGYRALIAAGALLGAYSLFAAPILTVGSVAALGSGSKLLRAIGYSLQKEGYTHVRGSAPEKTITSQIKLMSWNVCGIGAGFSYDHGGVTHWKSRLDGIVDKIVAEDPDVLLLQEIYDGVLAEALIDRLKEKYAHFYFHMGRTVWGSDGGCMVLSKCAPHRFTSLEFERSDWKLKRGFSTLEILASPNRSDPILRIIGTHLIHGDGAKDKSDRAAQIAQIVNEVAKQRLPLPTFIGGDFNIERDEKEGEILTPHLHHGYTAKDPTCTNRLVWQWDKSARSVWSETIDYISLFKENGSLPVVEKGVRFASCHLSPAFDATYNTKTALSDHQALVATIDLAQKSLS